MQQAIKILEDILVTTTMSKYATGAECLAARNVLRKAIDSLKEEENKKLEYFKHQKQLLERE